MNLFGYELRRKQKETASIPESQTRESFDTYWNSFPNSYIPPNQSLPLYDRLRETLPFLDVVPSIYYRMLGDFEIDTYGKENLKQKLQTFKERVQVGWYGMGFNNFLYQLLDGGIGSGMGIAEAVPEKSMSDINRLVIADPNSIVFVQKDGRLRLAQKAEFDFTPTIFENTDYIYYIAPDQRKGHPQGYSIYFSLPFVAQILYRMEKSIDNTICRIGDPTFIAGFEADKDVNETMIKDGTTGFITSFKKAMVARKQGQVRDIFFSAVGAKLKVDMLGNGKFIEGLEFPMNMMINQCVAKFGVPHRWLGFPKAEGMNSSASQVDLDMLTVKNDANRACLDPVIDRIFSLYLTLTGDAGAKWTYHWNAPTLFDEKEQAMARNFNAMAAEKELNVIEKLMMMGAYQNQEELEQVLQNMGLLEFALAKDVWLERLKQKEVVNIARQLALNRNGYE